MKFDWASFGYRALWEADLRSGFKAWRTPRGVAPAPAWQPAWRAWWETLPGGHLLRRLGARAHHAPPPDPICRDWHLEPHTGLHWPASVHWTRALTAKVGDVRLTWEANRFEHVWAWLAEHRAAAEVFESEVRHWRRANPFRAGVNWASGQELALRSMAWLHGAAAYGAAMTAEGWRELVELLYWHGLQIESEFGFARHAVRNNHLLAEALGLAMIGDAFPGLTEAPRWRTRGLEVFEAAVAEQFFDDGGYCQHSHAYHHFALGLLGRAADWFGAERAGLSSVFTRSLRYFEVVADEGGAAPNFGPNDRPSPPDYAALVDTLRARLGIAPTLALPRSGSFPQAGLHVLRNRAAALTLRCGPLSPRAGHDDGLHTEVWLGGVPTAVDAGSYSYHGAEHAWFCGARSHNVCRVDGAEPRTRLARFTWGPGVDPHLGEYDAARGLVTASYDAYPGVRWDRRAELERHGVTVTDTLQPRGAPDARVFLVHWLLDATSDEVIVEPGECFTWNIRLRGARITLRAEALLGDLDAVRVSTLPAWVAPAYGRRELATSLTLTATGSAVRFHSRFQAS